MAARRLIIILVILMLISTLTAALAPVEEEQPPDEDRTEQPAPEPGGGADLVEARIDAGKDELPVTIEVGPDTRLALTVRVPEPGVVTIPAFGLSSFTVPEAPARFDLLLREPGTTEVSLDGRTIGRIKAAS